MAVDNRVPWDIFRERKDEEIESPGTLFGTHLRPMGLNVLGRLPIPLRHRCHPSRVAKDLFHILTRRCQPSSNGGLYGLLVIIKRTWKEI